MPDYTVIEEAWRKTVEDHQTLRLLDYFFIQLYIAMVTVYILFYSPNSLIFNKSRF